MFHFRSADAVRQCAECAVGAGVRVAAHYGHARQRRALFGAHYVHDALAFVHKRKIRQRAEFFDVFVQSVHLQLGNGVLNAFVPIACGRVVVGGGRHAVYAPELAICHFQALKGLRAGYFVYQMAVYIQQHRAVFFLAHDVAVPKFVVEGLRGHGLCLSMDEWVKRQAF